jgi:hypothetical protein
MHAYDPEVHLSLLAIPQMDPKFLRNQRFAKKYNKSNKKVIAAK